MLLWKRRACMALLTAALIAGCGVPIGNGCDAMQLLGSGQASIRDFAAWLDNTRPADWQCHGRHLIFMEPPKVEAVEALLKRGVDPGLSSPESGDFPLAISGTWASVELARVLLDQGADPNQHDLSGKTALMSAAEVRPEALSLEYLEFIVRHGADPAATDSRGRTAADYARRFGNNEFARRVTGFIKR